VSRFALDAGRVADIVAAGQSHETNRDGKECHMQRIAQALSVCAAALLIAGCKTSQVDVGRVPDPDLTIRYRRPLPPPIRQPPRRKPVQAKRVVPRPDRRIPAEWIPPGGIRKSRWQCIVVHHSASPKATPESMHRYHLQERKWPNGLGYHFVIGNGVNYPNGKVFVGNRWRRQISGAHCKTKSGRYFGVWRRSNYFNTHGIGICLIGNFESSRPTTKQRQSLQRLIDFLAAYTAADRSRVYGHGEVTHGTACPGRLLNVAAMRLSAGRINAAAR
jgi:hypothetical protein